MSATLEWNGDEAIKAIDTAAKQGLDEAAMLLQDDIKGRLSRVGKFKSFDQQATQADRDFVAGNGLVDSPGGSPRLRSGRLRRAITTVKSGDFERTVGVHGNLAYAAIHEFGGTINHPGGQPYIVVTGDNGEPTVRFIKKGTKPKRGQVKLTKPHTITMPSRPFMRPAFQAKTGEMMRVYRERIAVAIAKIGGS